MTRRLPLFILALVVFPAKDLLAQKKHAGGKPPFDNGPLVAGGNVTVLPYNRLIRSAGTVVTYGDVSLENHALDLCILPGNKEIAVEDRYGIAVFNLSTKKMQSRWSYRHSKEWSYLVSTFSGITSFSYKHQDYIAWGASGSNHRSAVMMATLADGHIEQVTAIPVAAVLPADAAIPNQIVSHTEDGRLFLYAVLNGNNQLLKIDFESRKIMYAAPVGVAPYGLCIARNKAFVTNWAGNAVTDPLLESAGTPWGAAYTNPVTGAVAQGSLSVVNLATGTKTNEIALGLHPTAIIASGDEKYLYITNGNSDDVDVVNIADERVEDTIPTGLFGQPSPFYGSSPDALALDASGSVLYVANGMDNAIAVVQLANKFPIGNKAVAAVTGYIPTEAYPSGIAVINHTLYVTNLEAKGSRIITAMERRGDKDGRQASGYSIHNELASISMIPVPGTRRLAQFTNQVKWMNLFSRTAVMNSRPRTNEAAKPIPERIGEPSLFKHVVYIIKENKTYDEVFGDMSGARGDRDLCIFGERITPNQHRLAREFVLLDNYYASGKSSAEGHQWADAGLVSDYVEKNVRAWFRSYPHRQEDALVYNKNGFVWNNALDHGKKVRILGEACLTHYDPRMKWIDFYHQYLNQTPIERYNTTTIARIRPVISAGYPDCDNLIFTDQIRADTFIKEWKTWEAVPGDSLPDLMVVSLPDDHTEGTSPNFPTTEAMVADNDLALGRIVDMISHSRFWESTVIFVTEDDSQSGWDHISPYRTTCLVISPFSKLAKTVHTNYNQTSMLRSIEQILGLPPMNVIDATALPMFDCFGPTSNAGNYVSIPNNIPLDEMNKPLVLLSGKAKYYAKKSATEAFKELDSGDDDMMNRILWFAAKGNKSYPRIH